jgi:DNA-binding GntR family transcriptional regulator
MSEPASLHVERARAKRPRAAIERPKPLHEAVVERLRDMIVVGELAVGERLNDARLAQLLKVSRTPIREAIKLLASEGLVELLPGRGARVSAFTLESVGDLLEVIAGLERHACELAAERMSKREFQRLKRLHARMARHFAEGERPAYFKLNNEIHLAIVAAADNTILQVVHASLLVRARRARYAALATPTRWEEAMAEHERLMEALAAGDVRRAGEIMQDHDRRTARAILESLGPKSADATPAAVGEGLPANAA